MLEFIDVTYVNSNKTIIDCISMKAAYGDYITIVGPSGSGKSTFLKLCAHLVSPTSGSIRFMGRDVFEYDPVELRKRIAYCFQLPYLFGSTVEDNLSFPFAARGLKPELDRIEELFLKFRLDMTYLKKEVKNLSGGEKQRIALIRTLVLKPEVLLLDEVTSALDADNAILVENTVKELNQEGVTILWVTHNQEQSRKNAKRQLTIENGRLAGEEVLQ